MVLCGLVALGNHTPQAVSLVGQGFFITSGTGEFDTGFDIYGKVSVTCERHGDKISSN